MGENKLNQSCRKSQDERNNKDFFGENFT